MVKNHVENLIELSEIQWKFRIQLIEIELSFSISRFDQNPMKFDRIEFIRQFDRSPTFGPSISLLLLNITNTTVP
jgi:hypothetical protein